LLAAGAQVWLDALLGGGVVAADSTYDASGVLFVVTAGAALAGGGTWPIYLPEVPAGFKLQIVDFEINYGAAADAPLGPIVQNLNFLQHDQTVPGPTALVRGTYSRSEPGDDFGGLHIQRAADFVAGATAFPQDLQTGNQMNVIYSIETNTYNPPIWLYRLRILVRSVKA
jgi:hypothetical protein